MKKFAILNLSQDSFSNDTKSTIFDLESFFDKISKGGFHGIDIGFSATNPKVKSISEEIEADFLKKDLFLNAVNIAKKAGLVLSIDTIFPKIAKECCKLGFSYINDVNFLRNQEFIDVLNEFRNVKYILTHSSSVPAKADEFLDLDKNIIEALLELMQEKMKILEQAGINKSRIILDPGIGFGKNNEQSWEIIKNFAKFKILDCKVYLAHSRKRFLSDIASEIKDRDLPSQTITKMLEDIADYARVHV